MTEECPLDVSCKNGVTAVAGLHLQTQMARTSLRGLPACLHSKPTRTHQCHKARFAGHVQPLVGWREFEAHHAAVHLGGGVVLAAVDAEAVEREGGT